MSAVAKMPPLLEPTLQTPHHKEPPTYRGSSPNYFGLVVEPGNTTLNASGSRNHWSPPNSSVRSAAAASPQTMPLHANPDYAAFRRESQHGTSFKLHSNSIASDRKDMSEVRPKLSTRSSSPSHDSGSPRSKPQRIPVSKNESDFVPSRASPKRMLSSDSSTFFLEQARQESPALNLENSGTSSGSPPQRLHDEKHPRLSLPQPEEADRKLHYHRAETLPAALGNDVPNLATPQHIANILETSLEEVLLLDLRVSTLYGRSRISGALNLCIPTTLLKRTSYNVKRLADTFKDDAQKAKFENWNSCKCIIVYDGNSTQLKEAQSCVNILQKFMSEGWEGDCCIIRGGFTEFSRMFPDYIEEGSAAGSSSTTTNMSIRQASTPQNVAPVIGGCPMPATKNAANPFFGNIRQNMDLIGGVGQMPVMRPDLMTEKAIEKLPYWLKQASDERDNGRSVSDKFLNIERREQRRMQEALSTNVEYGTPGPDAAKKVTIAGIEKGNKNRYNNIWPYEHSRVKLQEHLTDQCDYVNASYVQTTMSSKKYVATQGPIPATFADFWNMVWQCDIRVIIMLTAESEGGQIKAHNYWNSNQYGPFKLKALSEHRASLEPSKIYRHRSRPSINRNKSSLANNDPNTGTTNSGEAQSNASSPKTDHPYVLVRKFTLAHENHPFERMREITQLQYSSWPDFGAPAHPAHLLGLVEQCDAVVRSNRQKDISDTKTPKERPVLVHCSAGCGRTGTFCTVDSVIDLVKKQMAASAEKSKTSMASGHDKNSDNPFFRPAEKIPSSKSAESQWLYDENIDLIEKTVEEFRGQRLSMVQSLRQFVLVYETVLEWLAAQNSEGSG